MAQPVSEIFQEKLASFLGHDENSQLDLSNHPPDALRQLIDTQNISAQILQKANSDDFDKFTARVTQFLASAPP
jgi:hypothetical protein